MSSNTIVAPTVLGDSLRRLAEIVDGAPSIKTAIMHNHLETVHELPIQMTTPEAVTKIAADLGLPTKTYGSWPGHKYTAVDIVAAPLSLHLFAEHDPHKELRRPVEATDAIEDRIDWGIQAPSVQIGEGDAA